MGYWPTSAPVEWSYTEQFLNGPWDPNSNFRPILGERAKKNLEGEFSKSSFYDLQGNWSQPHIITELAAIRNAARKEEVAYLNKYLKGYSLQQLNWKDVMQGFNSLLLGESTFRELLNEISTGTNYYKLASEDSGFAERESFYKDFSATFSGYVTTQLRSLFDKNGNIINLTPKQKETLLKTAVVEGMKKALDQTIYYVDGIPVSKEKYSSSKGKNRKKVQPYKELKQKMGTISRKNPIVANLIKDLKLNEVLDQAINDIINPPVKKTKAHVVQPKVDTWSDGRSRGTIREDITAFTVQSILTALGHANSNIEVTGSLGAKTDVSVNQLQYTTGARVDLSPLWNQLRSNQKDTLDNGGSLVAKNKKAFEDFFTNVRNAQGEIVFISDKSYTINSNYRGFTAQDNTSLANIGQVLGSRSSIDVNALLNYLSNTGKDMIMGEADPRVLTTLATQIGYFMFDTYSIKGNFSFSMVNLFELSGIYMPLSVYMEKMIEAIVDVEKDIKNYAKVSISYGGEVPSKDSPRWDTDQLFRDFRNKRLQETTITFKFLSNFRELITGMIGEMGY